MSCAFLHRTKQKRQKKEKTALLTLYRRPFYNPSLAVRDVCWCIVFHSAVCLHRLTLLLRMLCVYYKPVAFTATPSILFLFLPCAYMHRHNHSIVKVVFLYPPCSRRRCESSQLLELVAPRHFENFPRLLCCCSLLLPLWHLLVALCVAEDTTDVLFLVQDF